MKLLTIAIGFLVALAPTTAVAGPDDGRPEKPWLRGTTPAQRAEAEKLLRSGNTLFHEAKYRQALEVYRRAAAIWDHPAIRFNMTRALINLDRPVEAFENLELSLRYGRGPLNARLYSDAISYRRLLVARLAQLEVRCVQAGVVVSVDGRPVVSCPGQRTLRVLPGNRQIVGSRAGYLTRKQDVVVMPATKRRVDMHLLTIAEATKTRRRWAVWKPLAVIGGGVGLASLALLFESASRNSREAYDVQLRQMCPDTPCAQDALPESIWRRARTERVLAVSFGLLGAATLATGTILLILNRATQVLPAQGANLAPIIAPHTAGMALTLRY